MAVLGVMNLWPNKLAHFQASKLAVGLTDFLGFFEFPCAAIDLFKKQATLQNLVELIQVLQKKIAILHAIREM